MFVRAFTISLVLIGLLMPITPVIAKSYYHGYHGHRYYNTDVIYWNRSKFFKHPNGMYYSRNYNRQTIRDLVSLCRYHRMHYFYAMPNPYVGSIPYHLKKYAMYQFNRAGISVYVYQPRTVRYYERRPYYYHRSPGFSFYFRF